MKEIDLLKEAKVKTLQRIIEKFGGVPGNDLKDCRLNIIDVRDVLYEEINKIAERQFRGTF